MSGKIRFAPSPTGYLHEGHLLSALYVWAAAKKWQLQIHLRIENHDLSRARDAYIDGIREDLEWLGFDYDSESIQSERHALYEKSLEKLKQKGLIYPCYCSRKKLQAENPQNEYGEIIYQGKCRELFTSRHWPANAATDESACETESQAPHNLRIATPDEFIRWNDLRLGDFSENPHLQCGDFPVKDRDGQWTYQFAVCVDDLDEGITHIVRGEDIRNSTARQIALMQLLGMQNRPIYLHHPLIVDATGKKLSKREFAHSLRQDKADGATPEILFGRICSKMGLIEKYEPISLKKAINLIQAQLPELVK